MTPWRPEQTSSGRGRRCMTPDDRQPEDGTITGKQARAWVLWNESYHVPDGEELRALSRALYQEDMHERIRQLFDRLDEQNRRVEELTDGSEDRIDRWVDATIADLPAAGDALPRT